MSQPFRIAEGGRIDRRRPLHFRFDGKQYEGFAGDTLASALLANGVRTVARSFKYHRRRGIYTAGPEEPNALVTLGAGDRAEPNTRATVAELYDGLVAESQNRWPSLEFDLFGINNLLSPLFPAGFYYKTFKWPPSWWMRYEKFIRKAAGMGRHSGLADPDFYEHRYAHCDVLVAGGGPAGLAAALAVGRAGARVILCEERAEWGGALRFETERVGDAAAGEWVAGAVGELGSLPEVTLLPRCTAFGYFDHNMIGLIERTGDHLAAPEPHRPRQRLWLVRANRVILGTGAIERPLVFGNNDLPGVMLAASVRRYANEFGVVPGRRAIVFTNNDDAWRTAFDLVGLGTKVVAIVDTRAAPNARLLAKADNAGIPVSAGHAVLRALGGRAIAGVEIAPRGRENDRRLRRRIDGDLLCVSGGWSPTIHLHSQAGGKPAWRDDLAAFVPGSVRQKVRSIGAARGDFGLADCLAQGFIAGAEEAAGSGFGAGKAPAAPITAANEPYTIEPLWQVADARGAKGKRFVDLQDDVTAADIALAHRENYASVEHLKRYTTLGMGTDQGKTSNVIGLGILAELRAEALPAVGTTTFRPPYTPVSFGAIAGHAVGKHLQPTRRTPMHEWHLAEGALMYETGQWLRPRVYRRAGEDFRAAWIREAETVRRAVGLADVSTLGKIDIQGPDAAVLLDRVYCNGFKTLAVGKARYGLMLRDDGIAMDDGTTSRLAEQRYYMTTTTANAERVLAHLERLLQVDWPELGVSVTSVTDQWAQMALAGPESRRVLERCASGCGVSKDALPPLGVRDAIISGVPVRLFRVSYSGELAYEIAAPADAGLAVWQALLEAGLSHGIVPYGLEAMGALRIEKGHVAGPELNGQTTPADLGYGRMTSAKKRFIGDALSKRPAMADPDRPSLVGLIPADGKTPIRAGAQLVEQASPPRPMLGHVTSATFSPALRHPIALALLRGGLSREGQALVAMSPLTGGEVAVRVVSPHFYDPEGSCQNG